MNDCRLKVYCQDHPEGGLIHDHIYCHCELAKREQEAYERGCESVRGIKGASVASYEQGWNEAISEAVKVATDIDSLEAIADWEDGEEIAMAVQRLIAEQIKGLRK